MDLRNNLDGLDDSAQCNERLARIEKELHVDLSALRVRDDIIGNANTKNCEQMFGHVTIPIGLAGPLHIKFSSEEAKEIYLPLATTEGALIASINRGCKALSINGVSVQSEYIGMTRSIAFESDDLNALETAITTSDDAWKNAAHETSNHLQVMHYDIEKDDTYLFLTIACDTDLAMGMNMTTIAAQAAAKWISEHCDAKTITIAANVDSDKKPSLRTKEKGRGHRVTATARLNYDTMATILKTTPDDFLKIADAKLKHGSAIANALGVNCHSANIVAALYLATGQDSAHVVEGSLTTTTVKEITDGIEISVEMPAVLVGAIGGGTMLPAQRTALDLLLHEETTLDKKTQLAETVGAAVLAGETSLLAALATQDLAKAHKKLGR